MPPRRRTGPAAEAPTLLSLPEPVLLRVLEAVPLADRFRSAAPACRRLRTLCLAPELLRDLNISTTGARRSERLQALVRLMASSGEHVHTLRLHVIDDLDEQGEATALVAAVMAACGARQQLARGSGGGLRRLELSQDTPVPSLAWLPMLAALTELHLPGRTRSQLLQLDCGLTQLTALRSAHLSGCLVCSDGGPCLPASLTHLRIEGDLDDDEEPDLPAQVLAGLPNLRSLELSDSVYTSQSLAGLSQLAGLTRLSLWRVDYLPPAGALAALAGGLRALSVHGVVGSEQQEALHEALGLMSRLERLALDPGSWDASEQFQLPPALARLTALQRLSLSTYNMKDGVATLPAWSGDLPAGPWLASLRWLGLPLELAMQSAALLADARELECLCLFLPPSCPPAESHSAEQAAAFWQLVASHPPLRCLLYEVPGSLHALWFDLVDALLALQRSRPGLQVRRLLAPAERHYNTPQFWAE